MEDPCAPRPRRRAVPQEPPDQTRELGIDPGFGKKLREVGPAVHVEEALREHGGAGAALQEGREDPPRPPGNAMDQGGRAGPEAEKVDATVPRRTEHQGVGAESLERCRELALVEPESVRPHHDDLAVAEGANVRQSVFEPLRERASALGQDEGSRREGAGPGIAHHHQVDAGQGGCRRDRAVAQRREQALATGETLGAGLAVGPPGEEEDGAPLHEAWDSTPFRLAAVR